jgi:hypothetical protein
MSFLPLIALVLVAAAAACLRFTRLPQLAIRGTLAVLGVALGAMAWPHGVDPAVVGVTLTCCVIAAFVLPDAASSIADGALAGAVCAGLVVAAAVSAPVASEPVFSLSQVVFLLAAGTALAAGAGFIGRAALASERTGGAAVWMGGAAIAALATRRLSAYGPGAWTVNLPSTDTAGQPAFWLVDFGQGVPITLDVPDVATVGLLAAGLMALAGVAPLPRMVRTLAGAAGGLAALGVVAWLLALSGRPVAVDADAIQAFLKPIAVAQALEGGARPLGQAPFLAAAHLVTVPLALLACVGTSGLIAGLAGALQPASRASGWERVAQALEVRDSLQWGAVAVGIGSALYLVATHDLTGVWGPARAGEHVLSAAALMSAACAVGMHGLGGRVGTGWDWLRGGLVALTMAAVTAAIGGGLVSALGAFEMP